MTRPALHVLPDGARPAARELTRIRQLETKLGVLVKNCRLLPAITAASPVPERARLAAALENDESVVPRFQYPPARKELAGARAFDALRAAAAQLPGSALYCAKLDELEIDVAILSALGDARRIRPLAARRFGTGDEVVATPAGQLALSEYAARLIALRGNHGAHEEARTVPALTRDGSPSLAGLIREVARLAGLSVEIRVEANLSAGAATGDHTVYLADRAFGAREALRLAVHEVLGHLTSAANGREQPIRLPEWGTAGSFADQEGVALCMEDAFGVLDAGRLCALAGRVLATSSMHGGASFGDTARLLHREQGFSAQDAVSITERAYRGGGVARDAGYLLGYLRVRAAIAAGTATLDELRMGRVGVQALPALRELITQGLARPSLHRPSVERDFASHPDANAVPAPRTSAGSALSA